MSTFYIYFFLYKLPKIKYHPAIRQVDILMLKVMLLSFQSNQPNSLKLSVQKTRLLSIE